MIDLFVSIVHYSVSCTIQYRALFSIVNSGFSTDRDTKMAVLLSPIKQFCSIHLLLILCIRSPAHIVTKYGHHSRFCHYFITSMFIDYIEVVDRLRSKGKVLKTLKIVA